MRLWGKIKGTERDYYVAEGIVDSAPAEDGAEDGGAAAVTEASEPRGTGVNKFCYLVCNSPNGTWE